MSQYARTALILLLPELVLLGGCARARVGGGGDLVYTDPDFTAERVRTGGMALLPVLETAIPEDYLRVVTWELAAAIERDRPDLDLQPIDLTARRIDAHELDRMIFDAVQAFRADGTLDPAFAEVANALRVRYLLFTPVADPSRLHLRQGRRGDPPVPPGRYDARVIILDALELRVVWDVAAVAEILPGSGTSWSPFPETFAAAAARGAAARLPS
jgi:hypothetical protein